MRCVFAGASVAKRRVLSALNSRGLLSPFWRGEVQDQGVGGATLPPGCVPGPSPGVWRLLGLCRRSSNLHVASSLCVCLSIQTSPFQKDAGDIGLETRPTPEWPDLRQLLPQQPYFYTKLLSEGQGLGLQHMNWVGAGTQVSPKGTPCFSSGIPQTRPTLLSLRSCP